MNKLLLIFLLCCTLCSCRTHLKSGNKTVIQKTFDKTITDLRDQQEYGIVTIGNQIWFAENLTFETPKSKCYKRKKRNCQRFGRLYPYDELDMACPKGWRVPNNQDWKRLKSNFEADSIYALLDTAQWNNVNHHTNESGLSIKGVGYQLEKNLFMGNGTGTSYWSNQINKYDEYFHIHLYGGDGIRFEKSNYTTNEVFHAHPLDDIDNRRFTIRCMCDKSDPISF